MNTIEKKLSVRQNYPKKEETHTTSKKICQRRNNKSERDMQISKHHLISQREN